MDCLGLDNNGASNEISQLNVDLLDRRYNTASDTSSDKSFKSAQIPDNVLNNLKALLTHHPDGIPSLKLEREYYNLFKSPLDIQEWGYENLSHMLQLNSDILSLKKPDKKILKKYPENKGDILIFEVKHDVVQNIDYELKVKLVRLIFKYSKSNKIFPLHRWIEFYKEEYNEPTFRFDSSDYVKLFKILAKEFPIQLYITEEQIDSMNGVETGQVDDIGCKKIAQVDSMRSEPIEYLTPTLQRINNTSDDNEANVHISVMNSETIEQDTITNSDTANTNGDATTQTSAILNNQSIDQITATGSDSVDQVHHMDSELIEQADSTVIKANEKMIEIDVNPEAFALSNPISSGDQANCTPSELGPTIDDGIYRGVNMDHAWVKLGKLTQPVGNLSNPVQPIVEQDSNAFINDTKSLSSRENGNHEEINDMKSSSSRDNDSNEELKVIESYLAVTDNSYSSVISQTICVRAKPWKQIFNWRTKMVKEGKHQLITDLYEHADKLPEEISRPGSTYESITVKVNEKKIEQVIIVAVSNPNHIFVNLDKNKEQMRKLNEEMSSYFANIDLNSYIVPQDLIYEGFPCLIQAKSERTEELFWERSKIIKCGTNAAIVESVDYGGFTTVDLNKIYMIPKRWTLMHAQAIHVSLLGVKQKSDAARWTSDVALRIRDFSWTGYELSCLFIKEKRKSNLFSSYEVLLCDKHDPDILIFLDKILNLEGLTAPDDSRAQEIEAARQFMI